jgi:hypothetical protein
MTGSVTVSEGALVVNHSNALGAGIAITNVVTVANGGTIYSNQSNFSGSIANGITVSAGGTLGVGNAIGSFSSTSLKLNGGSTIAFKIWDQAQGAGFGYDKFDLGTLDLTGASSANRVNIKLISMSSALLSGEAFDFPLEGFRSFAFGSFDHLGSTGYVGNISDLFTIDVSSFYHSGSQGVASEAALWSINFDTANGFITLNAVPEPSTYGFGLGALALAAAAIRRRKKRLEPKA